MTDGMEWFAQVHEGSSGFPRVTFAVLGREPLQKHRARPLHFTRRHKEKMALIEETE